MKLDILTPKGEAKMEKEFVKTLGEHSGLLHSIQDILNHHTEKLERIDNRLRDIEVQSTKSGLISGAIISTVISIGTKLLNIK